MIAPEDQFRDAIRAAGLTPPDAIIADGKLRRFACNGKRSDDAGWYVFHGDGIAAGAFGDWRSGLSEIWRANIARKLSPVEAAAHVERVAAMRREREAEEAQLHAKARDRAGRLWAEAKPADPAHPYLARKVVKAHGIREKDGTLLVPMRDADGVLWNVERIPAEAGGRKKGLFGGRRDGCYHRIGKPNGTICVAEGYATGASIHEATAYAVAVAFNAGNLEAVARALRAKMPDARIILCADDDVATLVNPGRTKATEAARAVGGLVALADFGVDRPEGATDFNDLALHRGAEVVRRCVEAAREPEVSEARSAATSATEADSSGPRWPEPMDPAALHGIAGEFVRMVEPNTEADPAAILVQFLVAFGALVGRGPHHRVERSKHFANLYAVMVGSTSKARKGTSWDHVEDVFARIIEWKPPVKGLSSGEGLIHAVRDPREETKTNKHGESVTEVVDAGVADKRLLVTEKEFATVLRQAQRSGNILSATLREGWDSGDLRTLTKNTPETATGAHVCIVGHITADELRADLTGTDTSNGFANRFLYVAAKRSKKLPFGGEDGDEAERQEMADRLRERMQTARDRGRIDWSPSARPIWERVYPELSEGTDGLHGSVTARSEAQVVRLALVYALLDGADQIDTPHLLAALALWTYCDATARHIFGSSLGDRIADEVLRRLRLAGTAGMTRTDLRDAFGRHQSSERVGAALDLLRRKGMATCETVETAGRPSEIWRAAK